ncbi:MAG: four helix bundle protein [Planctomycetaceae bacterium]|nr:four helix bundle protein [Planctomycetaceae bacterium]
MKESILRDKSYAFALRIVNLAKYLQTKKREFILSKQILRSGTAIGALVRESERAESTADFAHKLNIALKEADETDFWLSLLKDSDFMNEKSYVSISRDCQELISILVASIITAKKNAKRKTQNENKE